MSQPDFSTEWVYRFTDPYALLGVSVAADDRRILKRYRTVAKQMHPDSLTDVSAELRQFAVQVLPKLVNPAYQRLKQEKGRNEVLATLRFKVRRLSRDQLLQPQDAPGQRLLAVPEAEVDVCYEHAVEQLCDRQYESQASFEDCTRQLVELNQVYLRRQMGTPVIREKRTGIISTAPLSPLSDLAPELPLDGKASGLVYAERHFGRAQEYLKAKNPVMAIQELKDALKIDPQNSRYHCLMGQAYLMNELPGMAKVHFKQALRIDPNNAVAIKYAKQLNIVMTEVRSAAETVPVEATGKRSRFGGLFSKGPSR